MTEYSLLPDMKSYLPTKVRRFKREHEAMLPLWFGRLIDDAPFNLDDKTDRLRLNRLVTNDAIDIAKSRAASGAVPTPKWVTAVATIVVPDRKSVAHDVEHMTRRMRGLREKYPEEFHAWVSAWRYEIAEWYSYVTQPRFAQKRDKT